MSLTSSPDVASRHDHDHDYAALLTSVRTAFERRIGSGKTPLFCVDTDGLWDTYLERLPAERQIHTCHACRNFIRRFGGLVTIREDGATEPALWDPTSVPEFYADAIRSIAALVVRRPVAGVFASRERVWGTPKTGEWTHLAVTPPPAALHRHPLLTPGQAAAAKLEDYRTVARALQEFSADQLRQVLQLLQAEVVQRPDRFIAPVMWLLTLHEQRMGAHGRLRDNILWRAVATAPEGFCHPRSGVIGSLMEDLAGGMHPEAAVRRFNAKMHPLKYQRPQAAPSAGNIAQAEKVVETLGIKPSLDRRFARLEEIQTIWQPKQAAPAAPVSGGVFSHLTPKGSAPPPASALTKPVVMTWDKFVRTVVPNAEAMELRTPDYGNFTAILTAADPLAPPILKWDREDSRNPFSTYVYHGGSAAHAWRLRPGWTKVTGICWHPSMWADGSTFLGKSAVVILEGAVDTQTGKGNALFPENLRTELHAVRSTIEAYSKRAEISGRDEASACGYAINGGSNIKVQIRARAMGLWATYEIDRWD